jgi:indolepyruvate ferredoxin oxidoreductase
MRKVANALTKERLNTALELARLPQSVRGYGHVKERNANAARVREDRLLAELAGPTADRKLPRAAA